MQDMDSFKFALCRSFDRILNKKSNRNYLRQAVKRLPNTNYYTINGVGAAVVQ